MNNKVQLTQSEVHNIVLESVKKILVNEGFFQKIGDKIDGIEQKFDDKMDDFTRGYDLKEGNPISVFDVIEGDGWEPVPYKEYPIQDGSNNIAVRKVRGAWMEHNGLSIEELIKDINIFLNGRGHAAHVLTVNANAEIINVNAPQNLIISDEDFEKWEDKGWRTAKEF
ncbi:MAG: hypothetical protein J6J23_02540 [Clostridia bacterium]|nr:hypothetical protein [Clostridia bacterium]